MDLGEDVAPASGLLQVLRTWSGQHPQRPARMARGEPLVLRLIAPLALLVMASLIVCTGFGYVLARQADDHLEARYRQALTGAIEALQAVTPELANADPKLIRVIERASGLKDLRFEREPAAGDREIQTLMGRNGRIAGWFSWEQERPATAAMNSLLPFVVLIAIGLGTFAALAMWQLSRLGLLLARTEQHVQKLEYEDVLTELPSHNRFFELFDQALATRRGDESLAFASLDLDGFDEVNDALGYAGGNEVLIEVAKRFRAAVPEGVILGRLGGDEFAMLMVGVTPEAAQQTADSVRQAFARPLWLNQVVQLSASIGLATAPQDGATRDELTRRADLALRAAKSRGRGSTVSFSPEMEVEFQERRFIKREIASALAARAFDVHYQPIVKTDGASIAGVEALLRWNHPVRGFIPPSVFIPVVEEAGLMDRLGEFVLRRAVSDAGRWPGLYVSVNLSPLQVRDRAIIDVVASALADEKFEPSRLVLEVTEGVLIDEPEKVRARLLELRTLGVRLALDDFGAGYSSLSYLQQLPFDKLKIDRSFVASLDQSANGGVIIQAIATLGRALGMDIVVEGVETDEQRVLLRLAGCNEMQGYLFARPMPREEVDRFLANTKSGQEGQQMRAAN